MFNHSLITGVDFRCGLVAAGKIRKRIRRFKTARGLGRSFAVVSVARDTARVVDSLTFFCVTLGGISQVLRTSYDRQEKNCDSDWKKEARKYFFLGHVCLHRITNFRLRTGQVSIAFPKLLQKGGPGSNCG